MAEIQSMTREQAAFYLEVTPYASIEEVKKAYREKVKQYHPDTNIRNSCTTQEYFYVIQQAYETMLTTAAPQVRPIRIFQTNQKAKTQFTKQKQVEKDREFLHQWEEKKKKQRWEAEQDAKKKVQSVTPYTTKEEEVLQKIRAIWLAETIHRQIAADKEKTELENKRKLYRAFMKQQMQEENGEKWD